jgi:carbon-monoxide dehydrogenase medium subunit
MRGSVTVGAMVRHAEVAASAAVQKAIPRSRSSPASSATGRCATWDHRRLARQQRPGGGLPGGGARPGATITTNKRKIEADKFFKGLYETALEPGELITQVAFPRPSAPPT